MGFSNDTPLLSHFNTNTSIFYHFSQSCKLRMDECARDFIQSNYLFFYAVLTKFKTPLFENK